MRLFALLFFWFFAAAQAQGPGSGLEIDQVEVKGVSLFTDEQIEKALKIAPGEPIERSKIIQTEESLLRLYHLKGYRDVQIQSRLVRKAHEDQVLVLEIALTEGDPVRISEIGVRGSESLTSAFIRKILTKSRIKSKDILDQEAISEGKRSILDYLASHDFIGSKVDFDLVVPSRSRRRFAEKAAYWVDVNIHLDLGEKVDFGFRGNTTFTRGYLDALVDEMRLLGLGKDYVSAIKDKIEDEYRNLGFASVQVTVFNQECPSQKGYHRKITYQIQEGMRARIENLVFDGNIIFSAKTLSEQFYQKASSLIQNRIFVKKEIQKTAELLTEWMKEQGYLAAKLITVHPKFLPRVKERPGTDRMEVTLYLYEGDQTVTEDIEIQGATVFNQEQIQGFIRQAPKQPLNLFSFEEGLEVLKKAYYDQGYLGFTIRNEGSESMIRYSHENRVVHLSLDLDEGPLYRVGKIEVEGLQKTKRWVVEREFAFKEGEILRDSQILATKVNLERLHIFQNITLRTTEDPVRPHYKTVWVTVHEADRGMLTWGPGVRNDLGVRFFSQLAYTNLWGRNHTASFSLNMNRRFLNYHFAEAQVQFAYSWHWFGLPDLTFRPSIFIGQTQYINFAASTMNVTAAWEKPFFAAPLLVGTFAYSLESINQFNAPIALDNQNLRIGTLTPKLTLDLRDNPLSPQKGYLFTGSFDFALPGFGSQDQLGYYRAQFRSDAYWSVFKDITAYFSFRAGYERSYYKNPDPQVDSIPLIKQFALGGIGSVRGYQQQEINHQADFFGQSLAYANYRFQLDLPFAGALKFGLFVDAANLLIDSFSMGGLRYGTGFGFHYQTPVGPVNFDWGFKVNPPPGAEPYVIHFSVGVI